MIGATDPETLWEARWTRFVQFCVMTTQEELSRVVPAPRPRARRMGSGLPVAGTQND